ncbi:hypothetical protein VW29_10040 [Devosia limi DSM 17137]|uniref:YtkA-like domain-containing protein n=1 Tax=Devosia limi DSM 17137 TaxID=1121477 RepID=A0A0F5LQX2_9HYPH|nr:hypothetical protein [Devosia limi]KKB84706.1 hypothetical protein VW29_10040 [Devosia limi DSM 17137]SHF57965.1 hypothetical protein SAMN02745223_03049 [Devosia limi DSM 17137]
MTRNKTSGASSQAALRLRWLPLAIFVLILLGLGAAPVVRMLSPNVSASFQQASLTVGGWQMVASAAAGAAGRITVLVDFIGTDVAGNEQPPRPQVSAAMVSHNMTISAPTAPDGATAFRADLTGSMPGEWIVTVEAKGEQLKLPVSVP